MRTQVANSRVWHLGRCMQEPSGLTPTRALQSPSRSSHRPPKQADAEAAAGAAGSPCSPFKGHSTACQDMIAAHGGHHNTVEVPAHCMYANQGRMSQAVTQQGAALSGRPSAALCLSHVGGRCVMWVRDRPDSGRGVGGGTPKFVTV